jgi:streptomycin 6-kinase
MLVQQLSERVEERMRAWNVVAVSALETPSSYLVFGRRDNQPVVLKVVRRPGDEWRCGEVLEAFKGSGIVRVYEYIEGAALLERLNPGTSLASLALSGRDEEATEILAEVMLRMYRPPETLTAFATVQDWGEGFRRYQMSGDQQLPGSLVEQGQQLYAESCASQQNPLLLHGDLQHYNVLFDDERGWLAIDPKGVVGEIEYEIGASLRNPYEKPELFTLPQTIERRLRCYEARLKLDANRALCWGFAQAVLSAIWLIEDGFVVDVRSPVIKLANTIWEMLT